MPYAACMVRGSFQFLCVHVALIRNVGQTWMMFCISLLRAFNQQTERCLQYLSDRKEQRKCHHQPNVYFLTIFEHHMMSISPIGCQHFLRLSESLLWLEGLFASIFPISNTLFLNIPKTYECAVNPRTSNANSLGW